MKIENYNHLMSGKFTNDFARDRFKGSSFFKVESLTSLLKTILIAFIMTENNLSICNFK